MSCEIFQIQLRISALSSCLQFLACKWHFTQNYVNRSSCYISITNFACLLEERNYISKEIYYFQYTGIVMYPGFAWLTRRVLDFMIEFIGPLYIWLQQFTNHYLTHCHLLPTGHSTGSTLTSNWTGLHYSVALPLFCTTYNSSART
jgi:hypothetical protein